MKSKSLTFIVIYIYFACIPLLASKILIITHNYNSPDFVEIQFESFKKFLKDAYEYVVFNDASDKKLADMIDQKCNKLGIKCIRIPQENRTSPNTPIDILTYRFWAGLRHAEAISYSLNILGFNYPGIVMMIDSDMFLIKNFCVSKYLENYDIAGLLQIKEDRVHFLWAGLLMFNMNKLPDKETMQFKGGIIEDVLCDTGGSLHYYLKKHPELKIRNFEQQYRLFLDENFGLYAINNVTSPSINPVFHPKCNKCQLSHATCTHTADILKEFGINQIIINNILEKEFIPKSEFVMQDTFLHYQSVSNWDNKDQVFLNEKMRQLKNFLQKIGLKFNDIPV